MFSGKLTISTAIFNSYVKLPQGNMRDMTVYNEARIRQTNVGTTVVRLHVLILQKILLLDRSYGSYLLGG